MFGLSRPSRLRTVGSLLIAFAVAGMFLGAGPHLLMLGSSSVPHAHARGRSQYYGLPPEATTNPSLLREATARPTGLGLRAQLANVAAPTASLPSSPGALIASSAVSDASTSPSTGGTAEGCSDDGEHRRRDQDRPREPLPTFDGRSTSQGDPSSGVQGPGEAGR